MASNANNWSFGKIVAVSAAAGIAVLLILAMLLSFAFWSALFWGLCIGGIVFVILWLHFSDDEDESGAGMGSGAGSGPSVAASAAAPATVSMVDEPGDAVDDAGAALAETPAVGEDTGSEDTGAEDTGAEDTGAVASDAVAVSEGAGSVIKPSKILPGQAELAARKGTWRYDGGDDAANPPTVDADLGEDYDKDGVHEGTDEGAKPEMLSVARDGGADNLKEIKGVGPKMEQMLNEMGVYHFDQIAGWSADEIAWVDANLKGFKGRVSRDGWVDQAKILMTGAETEFSQRVEDGKVY